MQNKISRVLSQFVHEIREKIPPREKRLERVIIEQHAVSASTLRHVLVCMHACDQLQ